MTKRTIWTGGLLKVIGAGFGRTGTSSLQAALERLGFGPCYHMQELLKNPSHVEFWEAAVDGDPVDWRKLFAEYEAAVDWPACSFYQELMEAYPDAKVVLTVRDPDRWHRSSMDTIYAISNSASSTFFFGVLGIFSPFFRKIGRTLTKLIWRGTFDGNFEDKAHATRVFEEHIREVKRVVPPEKLLVYEVKDGWEPLCDFLGVEDVPDEPFPHLNDTQTFRRMVWFQRAFAATGGVAAAFILYRLVRYSTVRQGA